MCSSLNPVNTMKFVLMTINNELLSVEENNTPMLQLESFIKRDFLAYTYCHNVQAEQELITKSIIYYADVSQIDIIITIGGMEASLNMVVTKATSSLVEKKVDELFYSLTLLTPDYGDVSLCGVRGNTLILNFPNHSLGVCRMYNIVQPVLKVLLKQAISCMPINNEERIDLVNREKMGLELSECHSIIIQIYQKAFAQTVNHYKYDDLLGTICAEDIVAKTDYPLQSVALKDGYGCNHSRDLKSNFYNIVNSAVTKIHKGEGVVCSKGDILPEGANLVVSEQDVELLPGRSNEQTVEMLKRARKFKDIKYMGSILRKGIALKDTHRIGPVEMGIYKLFDLPELLVYIKPKIGVFSTSKNNTDENYNHRIYFSQLSNIFGDYGFSCKDQGLLCAHDLYSTIDKLILASGENQVMVIIMNEPNEHTEKLFQRELNAEIIFNNVNLPRGNEITFLTYYFNGKKKYVFTLPNTLLPMLLACRLLIVPSLMHWIGVKNFKHMRVNVTINRDLELKDVTQYLMASLKYTPYDNCLMAINILTEFNELIIPSDINAILEIPSTDINLKWLAKGSKVVAFKLNNNFQ